MFDLLVINCGRIVTFKSPFVRGENIKTPFILENGAIGCKNGKISFIGKTKEIEKLSAKTVIDAENNLVTPGLIDPHTHIVFGGTRSDEFILKIKGLSYEDIRALGGGIIRTVELTRKEPKNNLKKRAQFFLSQFLSNGTTTIESKSGYGLNLETEIKILEILNELNKKPIEIVPTFLGAHASPPDMSKSEYTRLIINEMLPEIVRRKLARFCDVFLEKGYFGINETRMILQRAKELGLETKLHTNQFNNIGGIELAVEIGCRSVDHLEIIGEKEIESLSNTDTAAVLLPGFSFFSDAPYAPARKLIDKGAIVALGTDFNPGSSPTTSIPLIMSIACIKMRMTPEETLAATTINAAYAIGKEKEIGSIEIGKQADITIWNTNSLNDIPYFWGVNLVKAVIKNGEIAKN